jgi:hypothetical protein
MECVWCVKGYIPLTGIMCRTCHGTGKQGNTFHDHLDTCTQCREHPHNLCNVGAKALKEQVC